MQNRTYASAAFLALITCTAAAGEKTEITRYPSWEYQKYQRIAIGRFGAVTPRAAQGAGIVADKLTDLLTNNGAFTVLSRAELKTILTEQDLSRLSDVADPATAIPAGKIKSAQAIIVGKITEFEVTKDRVDQRQPRIVQDRSPRQKKGILGGMRVVEEVVPVFRQTVRIAGSIHILNTATNEVLFSYTTPPIVKEVSQPKSPPATDPQELISAALRSLAADFYTKLAPVTINVELNDKMLVVATGFFDGEYEKASKLYTSSENFLIAVRNLPDECDRNPFRIGIALKDGQKNVIERELVWEADAGERGVSIQIPMSELAPHVGDKKAEFVAKLYSGPDSKPLLERKFKVEVGGE